MTKKAAAPQVLKILPTLKTLDGEMAGLDSGDSTAGNVRDAGIDLGLFRLKKYEEARDVVMRL